MCRKQIPLLADVRAWHVAVGAWGNSQSPEGAAEFSPRQSTVEPLPVCAWSADHVNKVGEKHACVFLCIPYHEYMFLKAVGV